MRIGKLMIAAAMVLLGLHAAQAAPTTKPATRPVQPQENGIIILHARDVIIHGTTVRYESLPIKNTVGFWMKKEDWVSWDFNVTKPGKYNVVVFQGCGKGSGGSEVEVSVGEQKLPFKVDETGAFQTFKERFLGVVDLTAGVHTLKVIPQSKPGLAVMDLHAVELLPVEEK
jgi:arylsulfatase A